MQTLRQLSFGFLDLGWYGAEADKIEDVKAQEMAAMSKRHYSNQNQRPA